MKWLLVLLFGCSRPIVIKVPTPVQVKVVDQPSAPAECWLPAKPEPLPEPVWPDSPYDGDFGKAFIHRRDYDALLKWAHDWDHWASTVELCVIKLRTQHE